ncbi:MAG: reverse transcriptase domain-containing protein, partial [Nitrososphaera sp.]|nr:reverse transcriptase domain-containing protein [Nitrososphaera sp.]
IGVGIPGGCQAAVPACRRYLQSLLENHLTAKLDFSNAFNCLHRDSMLQAIEKSVPELLPLCMLAYGGHTVLKFGNRSILSQEGLQQGDPLGPFIFCLTIHPLLQSLRSNLVIGYMDDVTLAGPDYVVAADVEYISSQGVSFGLHLNVTKCERIGRSSSSARSDTIAILSSFAFIPPENALLGPALNAKSAFNDMLEEKVSQLQLAAIFGLCSAMMHYSS